MTAANRGTPAASVAKAPPKWDSSQPDSNRIGYINYDAYVINKAAKDNYKAAAMLWLDFYRSKEACLYELLVEGNDSMLPHVHEDPDIKDKVNWEFAKYFDFELEKREIASWHSSAPYLEDV